MAWYANKGSSPARAKVLYWMVVATFGLLLLRLWHLQVIEGEEFRRLCESNRIRLVKVAPLRGRIFDRKGRILADNRPSFDLFVIPEDVKDKKSFAEGLAPLLGMPPEEILGKISQRGRSPFQPVRIKEDLTWEELSRIKIRQMELPGLKVSVVPVRTYLYRGLAAHLLGTVGEITREELSRRRAKGYDIGDYLGKTGLEAAWEDYLRGLKGGRPKL